VTAIDKAVDDELEQDDFLAFWRSHEAATTPTTARILGVDVVVPTDMPLRVEQQALLLQDAQDIAEIRPLLVDLFGADHLDTWITNGATTRMLQVIIAWGMANATGTETTFARAVELADEARAAEAGKARPVPNRSDRRAPSGTGKSASTGRSSSPTSAANTGTRRKKSVS
jgi:hypothetical protein